MSQGSGVFAVRRWKRRLVAVALLAVIGLLAYRYFANGGPAHQVKDIAANGASAPQELTDVDGMLFFSADDDHHGRELWMSDGTDAGTSMVKDIFPGPKGWAMTPVAVAGTAFFVEDDGRHGYELWKSDGTVRGTVMVEDLDPGPEGSWPSYLIDAGGTLLFAADDGTHGRELWTSDGTAAGTVMVKDIWQGTRRGSEAQRRRQAFLAMPRDLAQVGDVTFFTADDGAHGRELWTSDGTAAGTVQVRDVRPGPLASNPGDLIDVDGVLFFTANDGTHDRELWRSDGTASGTVLVKDVDRVSTKGPASPTEVDGAVYFALQEGDEGDQLWRSDGTAEGTGLVKVINPGAADSNLGSFTGVGTTLFFTASGAGGGPQLWRSDGTGAGTVLVKDLPGGPVAGPPAWLTPAGGILYFVVREIDHEPWDAELWRSDGTAAGTFQVQDIQRGERGSAPSSLTVVGDTLFFATGNDDAELWALPIDRKSSPDL